MRVPLHLRVEFQFPSNYDERNIAQGDKVVSCTKLITKSHMYRYYMACMKIMFCSKQDFVIKKTRKKQSDRILTHSLEKSSPCVNLQAKEFSLHLRRVLTIVCQVGGSTSQSFESDVVRLPHTLVFEKLM